MIGWSSYSRKYGIAKSVLHIRADLFRILSYITTFDLFKCLIVQMMFKSTSNSSVCRTSHNFPNKQISFNCLSFKMSESPRCIKS